MIRKVNVLGEESGCFSIVLGRFHDSIPMNHMRLKGSCVVVFFFFFSSLGGSGGWIQSYI